MQRFLTRIESHQHVQIIIFEVIHIEYTLINKAIYFNFENMKALCGNNAEKFKFWFLIFAGPLGARYASYPTYCSILLINLVILHGQY